MSEADLIDLTVEENDAFIQDENKTEQQLKNPSNVFTEEFTSPTKLNSIFQNCLLTKLIDDEERRISLDNNPFDLVQKIATRDYDPFEIVEKEACLKARRSIVPNVEVKMGNLLSLSDENLTKIDDGNKAEKHNNNSKQSSSPKKENIKGSEESPVMGCGGQLYRSSSESSGGGSGGSGGAKKKSSALRNRLLKMSLSNSSSLNSPVNRKLDLGRKGSKDGDFNSPLSSMLEEAAQFGENMLGAESPLRLVDDDLIFENSPGFEDNDFAFEAELEMMKIPMLEELTPSQNPPIQDLASSEKEKTLPQTEIKIKQEGSPSNDSLSKLKALKAKLKANKQETENNQEVTQLIETLKGLISDINEENSEKKRQAASLLELLGSSLAVPNKEMKTEVKEETDKKSLQLPPQPIKRQGTFDIDLQAESEDTTSDLPIVTVQAPSPIPLSLESIPKIEDIPDCMFKSSATYDGELDEEKRDYLLPVVEPLSPLTDEEPLSPIQPDINPIQPDVNEIVEQLSRLLEQRQLTQQSNNTNGSASGQTINPTFIVVMNTSSVGQLPNISGRRSSYMANESQASDVSPDFHQTSSNRRRSQSLSIHDKVKFVKLTPNGIVHAEDKIGSQSNLEAPQMQGSLLKTPSKLSRRNSFTNGTLYEGINPLTLSAKRALETKISLVNEQNKVQKPPQQQAIVRPLPPVPKRKFGKQSESIFKPSAPLKATVPVKKVASSQSESRSLAPPETPASNKGNHFSSSIQKNKNGKMLMTSTPMPRSGSSSNLLTTNASSMQALNVTPMKKASTLDFSESAVSKPRYSTTPTMLKASTTSVAAAGLKRRTLSELKAKSPAKPRISTNFSGGSSSNSATSRLPNKTSTIKAPQTKTSLPATRPSTSRLSIRPMTTNALRNKENKKP